MGAKRGGGSSWAMGIAVAVLGFIGLLMAANAADGTFYWVGMLIFGFAVLFNYGLIVAHTGARADDGDAAPATGRTASE